MGDLLAILDLAHGGGEKMSSEKIEKARQEIIAWSNDKDVDHWLNVFESAVRDKALEEAACYHDKKMAHLHERAAEFSRRMESDSEQAATERAYQHEFDAEEIRALKEKR